VVAREEHENDVQHHLPRETVVLNVLVDGSQDDLVAQRDLDLRPLRIIKASRKEPMNRGPLPGLDYLLSIEHLVGDDLPIRPLLLGVRVRMGQIPVHKEPAMMVLLLLLLLSVRDAMLLL